VDTIHTGATASSVVVQPTQTAHVPSSHHQPRVDPGGRWGWLSRHPIATTFSIAVLVVVVLIIVMIVTLNGGVQQLYNQIPYNETGVSALRSCSAHSLWESLLTPILGRLR